MFFISGYLIKIQKKKQEITTAGAKNIVAGICKDCTISEVTGAYTHDDGTNVIENTLKVELLFKTDEVATKLATRIKKALNQESVVLEIVPTNSRLI